MEKTVMPSIYSIIDLISITKTILQNKDPNI